MTAAGEYIEEVTQWTCEECGKTTLSRTGAIEHVGSVEDERHEIQAIIEVGSDRGFCGLCGKESSLSGLSAHCRDKFGHPSGLPHVRIETDAEAAEHLPLRYTARYRCLLCGTVADDRSAFDSHQCVSFEAANAHVRDAGADVDSAPSAMASSDHPARIAHNLLTNDDEPVRIYLAESQLEVPTEPYRRGTLETTTAPVSSFEAVVERIHVEDAGMSLMGNLHLPEQEWERVGLQNHWDAEDADTVGHQRHLEIWATRENNYDRYDEDQYDPTAVVDEDSPLLKPYRERDESDWGPTAPQAPLECPTLSVYVAHAEDASIDAHGLDRLEVGRIDRVVPLDNLEEMPQRRTETRDWPESAGSPAQSRHPTIEYDDLEPLPVTGDVLDALYTINRTAKRLNESAQQAYHQGDGATAKVRSVQKHALYDVKTVALHRLAVRDPAELSITPHEIDGTKHWLFEFEHGSFHQPAEAVVDDLIEDHGLDTDAEPSSIEYSPDPGSRNLPMSIEEALEELARFGINANDYLSQTTVTDYQWNVEQYTGWDIPTS